VPKAQPEHEKDLPENIGRKAERKIRARKEDEHGVWFGLGMFGLVGWSIAIPTLLGIALGMWLDATLNDRVSWTLMLLFVGVCLGCLNAWYWVKREGGRR
jgi:ATP synthase protein I